ncbi:MAG: hypothetical protein SFT92_08025 [Rickettsiales bacterium]|nr:hypothetical protein [Rickettsiales bacterium]
MSSTANKKALKNIASIHQAMDEIPSSLEPAITELERAVLRIMESNFSAVPDEEERLYWRQLFKNIATPISLALGECRGPRHFHYHYRHREDDDSVLFPVLERKADMLAHTCEKALEACHSKLVGIRDTVLIKKQHMLETALKRYVLEYKRTKQAEPA